MQQEQHFDDSIRKKLQEEEFTPPPFADIVNASAKGSNSLRRFLMSDVILLFLLSSFTIFSLPDSFTSGYETTAVTSKLSNSIESSITSSNSIASKSNELPVEAISDDNNTATVQKKVGAIEITSLSTIAIDDYTTPSVHAANVDRRNKSSNSKSPIAKSESNENAETFSSPRQHKRSNPATLISSLKSSNASGKTSLSKLNVAQSAAITPGSEELAFAPEVNLDRQLEMMDLLPPLGLSMDTVNDVAMATRDLGMSPMTVHKPFSIDVVLIDERTLGYNKVYPDVSQLALNLSPSDNGIGGGILFNYRLFNHAGIKTGLETIRRNYTLNYNYTNSYQVMQSDCTFVVYSEILTNSRSVAETEVRVPVQFTWSLRSNKWIFEVAPGFNIKFKNLNVMRKGNDEIPAALLSTIQISNEHLVTMGWLISAQVGYEISPSSMLFLTPYFQAESFGKNSRQYYTGRAVSGAGLKAGIRFLFNKE